MKRFFACLFLFFVLRSLSANEVNDTVVVVQQPQEVVILEKENKSVVQIKGRVVRNENGQEVRDTTYRFDYEKGNLADTETYLEQQANSWDFNMILGGVATKKNLLSVKNKKEKKTSRTFEVGGIGFGFVNALGAPKNMKVDMAASKEIFFDAFRIGKSYNYGKHKLSVGLGFHWRNYRMTGKSRFAKNTDELLISSYPQGSEIDYSRIKVFSITFPLQYEFKLVKDFKLNAAAILNVNTYASMETQYRLDGQKQKEFTKHIHHTPVSVDLRAAVEWKSLGVYFKYAPCKVLNTAYGPSFSGLSAGVMFGF